MKPMTSVLIVPRFVYEEREGIMTCQSVFEHGANFVQTGACNLVQTPGVCDCRLPFTLQFPLTSGQLLLDRSDAIIDAIACFQIARNPQRVDELLPLKIGKEIDQCRKLPLSASSNASM